MDVALLSERGFPGDAPARHGTGAGPVPGGGGGAPGVLGRAVASPRDDVTRAGHGARGPAPRRRAAGGGGRRRRATSGSGIAWWWSGRPVAAAVIIRWRPGRADPPGPRVDDITAAARGEAPGGGISTRSNRRGACDKGGSEDQGGGDRRPAPRARRPPPHHPGPRGWRPRGRRPTRVPAACDPSSPGASRSRQTSAPGRPDGRTSRGTISPSPVQPSSFLSSLFNL